MAYTPHEWSNGETITAAKLNNIEEGIGEAAQSGGGYDLVILADATGSHTFGYLTTDDITVVRGNILDVEEKVDNGEPVNAVLVLKGAWSYKPSTANSQLIGDYLPLTFWEAPYCSLHFSAVIGNIGNLVAYTVVLQYDYESGEITYVAAQNRTIL